jgi:hypothetical protein
MELLLKRTQTKSGWCQLFAKFELKPDEQAILDKSEVRERLIWLGDPLREHSSKIVSRILGVVVGFVVWVLLMGIGGDLTGGKAHVWLIIFAIPVGWWVKQAYYNHVRETLSVEDLLTGCTVGGGEEMLRLQEQAIAVAAQEVNKHLQAWKAGGTWGGDGERIAL